MEVVRFMSEVEKEAYLAGGKLMNLTNHHNSGMNSTSIGFCFAELTAERDEEKWLRKLMGFADCEYCIVFDTDDFKEPLMERTAVYADDKDFDKGKCIEVREWSTTIYQLDTHPYKRIGKCPSLPEIMMYGKEIEWLDDKVKSEE